MMMMMMMVRDFLTRVDFITHVGPRPAYLGPGLIYSQTGLYYRHPGIYFCLLRSWPKTESPVTLSFEGSSLG